MLEHERLGRLVPAEEVGVRVAVGVGRWPVGRWEALRWYGLGPWETEPDRLAGATLATWEDTVTGRFTPYLMPQEMA